MIRLLSFVLAQLMADYVSPALLGTNNAAPSRPAASLIEADEHTLAIAPKRFGAGERWEKFEAEFGVRTKDPSLVKGSLESAKYQLDKTTFAVQEFVGNVTDAMSFDYGWNNLTGSKADKSRPSASYSLLDSLENARLKSDISLNVAGRSFVGIKLVLPIGD